MLDETLKFMSAHQDIAAWVSGVGTIAALAGALIIVMVQHRLDRTRDQAIAAAHVSLLLREWIVTTAKRTAPAGVASIQQGRRRRAHKFDPSDRRIARLFAIVTPHGRGSLSRCRIDRATEAQRTSDQ